MFTLLVQTLKQQWSIIIRRCWLRRSTEPADLAPRVDFSTREAKGFVDMHSALAVAQKLLDIAKQKEMSLTPMKLIKLTYLCHGFMLGMFRRPLFFEPIEAWAYGPAIKTLYTKVRKYGSNPVLSVNASESSEEFDDDEMYVINETFKKYGGYTGPALSRLTHQPDSPWYIAYNENDCNTIISNDLISDHFSILVNPKPPSPAFAHEPARAA